MAELVHRNIPVKAVETQDVDVRHPWIEKRTEWRWKDDVNRWITVSTQLFNVQVFSENRIRNREGSVVVINIVRGQVKR